MYSDELPGEGQDAVAGPARPAPPARSSSGMSDSGARQSGSIARGSGSMMSSQMIMGDDPGSNRASLMGSNRGSVAPDVTFTLHSRKFKSNITSGSVCSCCHDSAVR